jgi:hypothetical protein
MWSAIADEKKFVWARLPTYITQMLRDWCRIDEYPQKINTKMRKEKCMQGHVLSRMCV